MNIFEEIKKQLAENNIEYKMLEHEPVRTSEEAARVRGVELKTGAKSMVLKAKDQYVLCVLPADQRVSWKKVKQLLGVKEIRFATEEEASEITHVEMGSVPPFGNIIGLPTYYEETLLQNETVNFNPGSRSHTISMKAADLVKLVQPKIVSII